MKRTKLITALIATTLVAGIQAHAQKQEAPKKQTICPVMGGKINKMQYTDIQGKRIYVCCPGCIAKIKADPETYIRKMEAEGITLDKMPKKENHTGHDHAAHKH